MEQDLCLQRRIHSKCPMRLRMRGAACFPVGTSDCSLSALSERTYSLQLICSLNRSEDVLLITVCKDIENDPLCIIAYANINLCYVCVCIYIYVYFYLYVYREIQLDTGRTLLPILVVKILNI